MFNKIKNIILLFITAAIWGSAFVAQKYGADSVTPLMFNAIRSFLGGLFLIPVILLLGDKAPGAGTNNKNTKTLLIGGILCGIALFIASFLQQSGITEGTDAGKSGFITSLYIVLVPVFSIFLGKKSTIKTWASVILAVIGLYFVCVKSDFTIGLGDMLLLGCAGAYAVHILVIDNYTSRVESVKMAMIQFFTCGILSLIFSFIFGEVNTVDKILTAYIPLLYTGILSSGVAYTLQIVSQREMNATLASMIMSLESVFALLTGMLFGERMGLRQLCGCIVIFSAVILSQLPEKSLKRKKKSL